ncbi:MAG: DUF721 domain-containing protein [Planctomycetota bacterium]|nr:DUF721 domain-containing protein [Planctomycetota bacterium]
MTKRKGPEHISDILGRILPRQSEADYLARARKKWRAVLGERFASRTKVLSVGNGLLRVRVSSSALLADLDMRKDELLSKVREGEDAIALRAIVFTFGRGKA